MPLMRAPKDPRANRPGMGGDPWRLVCKWNLIEEYPDVGFAAFINNEDREKALAWNASKCFKSIIIVELCKIIQL